MLKKLLVTGLVAAFGLSALTSVTYAQEETVLKVASQVPPMTDIVELAAEAIEEPYTIELVEVTDNVQYNEAVFNDEAYASFAQHMPFMEMFNKEKEADLVAIQPIYNAVVGFYSPVYKSIDDIEEGAEVAIPSDPTNEARALLILAHYGLIELPEDIGLFPTVDDIVENPHQLKFTTLEVGNTPAAYEDGVELVFSYPTYIAKLDLTPADALFLEEDPEDRFAIQVVVREGNKDSEATKALIKAFNSDKVRAFVDELSEKGHLKPSFDSNATEEPADSETTEESAEE
ncbi:MetQ/NlpA family ABC transporter substrate-binding protein [Facklamia languida]|uniref:YaeC family lipoprotein n=1 Tax=Facklamia languida CCUG 37842 TaxID=883113 RepID=H3NHV9_9LACT|nr:MetQ/NlpA family ABC transporter substrate-binding protein [Facklamia languida]EHR37758.1 YaeC family lipoprotein [Facklamia languida CCUG 37842]